MHYGSLVFGTTLTVTLSWATVTDVRARTIPNLAPAVITVLWLLHLPLEGGWDKVPVDLIGAASVFAVGFASWRCGLLGGGDVKLDCPLRSGGFAKEPEHLRRAGWRRGKSGGGSPPSSRPRRSSGCWTAARGWARSRPSWG